MVINHPRSSPLKFILPRKTRFARSSVGQAYIVGPYSELLPAPFLLGHPRRLSFCLPRPTISLSLSLQRRYARANVTEDLPRLIRDGDGCKKSVGGIILMINRLNVFDVSRPKIPRARFHLSHSLSKVRNIRG